MNANQMKDYVQRFVSFIDSKEDKKLSAEYRLALSCLDTPEKFTCSVADYNGRPNDFLLFCLAMVSIHIFPTTTIDVGEDETEERELGEDFYFDISDVFDKDQYTDEDFYVESKGEWYINPEFDDGEMSDMLSNVTGFCVVELLYELY